ncbi:anaphase-promoting complex subunit 4-like [Dipodomys spectabilis]|uniref:anaphase-promoting complex subunit 4-like n=1 Tax=Dipodomys spectabilis TaxID=105255 RepID=UPI001C5478C9|nr:anaphase-promoting complex subunit 4-like [Dipodomys spectabilis]
MARKFIHISALLQYINLSLTCMCEAWEEILMQMDSRLTKFVQEKNTTTSVQDEFMHLLLWGKARIIDISIKNFKAFFRWLYVAMLRMTEDHVLPELNKAPDFYNRKRK